MKHNYIVIKNYSFSPLQLSGSVVLGITDTMCTQRKYKTLMLRNISLTNTISWTYPFSLTSVRCTTLLYTSCHHSNSFLRIPPNSFSQQTGDNHMCANTGSSLVHIQWIKLVDCYTTYGQKFQTNDYPTLQYISVANSNQPRVIKIHEFSTKY